MKDTLQRFIFTQANVRGEIVHLDDSLQAILLQHAYPEPIAAFLTDVLLAAALMAVTMKQEGQLTVQLNSDGPVKLLVGKCNNQLQIKGLARFDHEALASAIEGALSSGQIIVTYIPDGEGQPYQGIVPLEQLSVSKALAQYFLSSEQLPTRFWFAKKGERAAGLMLQILPHEQRDQEDQWQHLVTLTETITKEELLDLDNETLLRRLYHQEDVQLFKPQPVNFHCNCSHERMENLVESLGQDEVNEVLQAKAYVEVICEYCNHEYTFDRAAVEAIFSASSSK